MAKAPITISTSSGKFSKATALLDRLSRWKVKTILERHGSRGVSALKAATPTDTGATANAWSYTVGERNGQYWLNFHNGHYVQGVPIAIVLQYGHATGTGGWVEGRDYINPVIKPIFEKIFEDVKREVRAL